MSRNSSIILLSIILIFSCSFLLFFYNKKEEPSQYLEGLTLFDSVKAAADAEASLISALKNAAQNPTILAAISKLPDGGAELRAKMDAASQSINAALVGATYYTVT